VKYLKIIKRKFTGKIDRMAEFVPHRFTKRKKERAGRAK